MDLVQQIIIWLFSEIIISEHFLYYGGIEQKNKKFQNIPQKKSPLYLYEGGYSGGSIQSFKTFQKVSQLGSGHYVFLTRIPLFTI